MLIIKENSGKNIRSAAASLSIVGTIISCVIGLAVGISIFSSLYVLFEDTALWVGIIVGIIVFAVVKYLFNLLAMLISGFGEIVQYTAESATYLEALAGIQSSTGSVKQHTKQTSSPSGRVANNSTFSSEEADVSSKEEYVDNEDHSDDALKAYLRSELENAGLVPEDLKKMDDDERRQVIEYTGLDPDDFDPLWE